MYTQKRKQIMHNKWLGDLFRLFLSERKSAGCTDCYTLWANKGSLTCPFGNLSSFCTNATVKEQLSGQVDEGHPCAECSLARARTVRIKSTRKPFGSMDRNFSSECLSCLISSDWTKKTSHHFSYQLPLHKQFGRY